MFKASEWVFECIIGIYERTLPLVLRHQFITLLVTLATLGFTVYLYVIVPKGLFPQQDTGRLIGNIQADQNISYHAMEPLLNRYAATILDDPAVESLTASIGGQNGGAANASRMFVTLKPLEERGLNENGTKVMADDVIGPAASQTQQDPRRLFYAASRAGLAHRQPRQQARCISSPCRATVWTTCRPGDPSCWPK